MRRKAAVINIAPIIVVSLVVSTMVLGLTTGVLNGGGIDSQGRMLSNLMGSAEEACEKNTLIDGELREVDGSGGIRVCGDGKKLCFEDATSESISSCDKVEIREDGCSLEPGSRYEMYTAEEDDVKTAVIKCVN